MLITWHPCLTGASLSSERHSHHLQTKRHTGSGGAGSLASPTPAPCHTVWSLWHVSSTCTHCSPSRVSTGLQLPKFTLAWSGGQICSNISHNKKFLNLADSEPNITLLTSVQLRLTTLLAVNLLERESERVLNWWFQRHSSWQHGLGTTTTRKWGWPPFQERKSLGVHVLVSKFVHILTSELISNSVNNLNSFLI